MPDPNAVAAVEQVVEAAAPVVIGGIAATPLALLLYNWLRKGPDAEEGEGENVSPWHGDTGVPRKF